MSNDQLNARNVSSTKHCYENFSQKKDNAHIDVDNEAFFDEDVDIHSSRSAAIELDVSCDDFKYQCERGVSVIINDPKIIDIFEKSYFPSVSFSVSNSIWPEMSQFLLVGNRWKLVADALDFPTMAITAMEHTKCHDTAAISLLNKYDENRNSSLRVFIHKIIILKMWDVFSNLFENCSELRDVFEHKCSNGHRDKIKLPTYLKDFFDENNNVNECSTLVERNAIFFIIWIDAKPYDSHFIDILKCLLSDECGFPVVIYMEDLDESQIEHYMEKVSHVIVWWSNDLKQKLKLAYRLSFMGRFVQRFSFYNKLSDLMRIYQEKTISLYLACDNNDTDMHLDFCPKSKQFIFANRKAFKKDIVQFVNTG